MLAYVWPLALVVLSNVVYQISSKSVSQDIDPFASLTVTYLIGAAVSAVLYFTVSRGSNLWKEYSQLNWASVILGLAVVGLEAGWIFAYRAGWPVSTGFIVQSAVLAALLLAVGYFLYHEAIPWNRLVGVGICLVGLVFINYK